PAPVPAPAPVPVPVPAPAPVPVPAPAPGTAKPADILQVFLALYSQEASRQADRTATLFSLHPSGQSPRPGDNVVDGNDLMCR
ncbi:MAG: hypothetical protein ACOVO0_00610, partial [Burkholderiaceae bacterium]